MRRNIVPTAVLVSVLAFPMGPRLVPAQAPCEMRQAEQPPAAYPAPTAAVPPNLTGLGPAVPEEGDRALPINLATALRLADARPIIIEAARAAVETEYGLYEQARALWLPTVYLGVDYQRHDGGQENALTGGLIVGTRNQFLAGAGAKAVFALADAIYAPLAGRQLLQARNLEVQTAKNDALLSVAVAYFDVQQARGILAGALDSVAKARDLSRRIGALGRGLAAPIEVERARATLADLEQQAASFRQDWRFSSATLTRALRLDPAAVVLPLEPPHLQVTLIAPQETVDALIPSGLMSRPELASQQSVVQATLTRLRQERMRRSSPASCCSRTPCPTSVWGRA